MKSQVLLSSLIALAMSASALGATAATPPMIAAAVADSGRPPADVARDPMRKPAEMLAFARVRQGETVLELLSGGGYFTRLFSKAVGPTGTVLAANPPVQKMSAGADAIAADSRYSNVHSVAMDAATLAPTPQVDLIFTAQNYHDLHLTQAHQDVPFLDKLFFGKLKSGGYLVIIDHVANAGAPVTETADTLHRIDPAMVRQEAEAAGFVFDGMSEVLRNPADTHMLKVFDPAIRGKTDQFVFRFRKP